MDWPLCRTHPYQTEAEPSHPRVGLLASVTFRWVLNDLYTSHQISTNCTGRCADSESQQRGRPSNWRSWGLDPHPEERGPEFMMFPLTWGFKSRWGGGHSNQRTADPPCSRLALLASVMGELINTVMMLDMQPKGQEWSVSLLHALWVSCSRSLHGSVRSRILPLVSSRRFCLNRAVSLRWRFLRPAVCSLNCLLGNRVSHYSQLIMLMYN